MIDGSCRADEPVASYEPVNNRLLTLATDPFVVPPRDAVPTFHEAISHARHAAELSIG